ncbi:hypothetical protein FALCPG4_008471 [Fusarium falciforme]
MAALLRSQDALDLETAIHEWQSRQNERQHSGPAQEPDEKSAVARLTAALDTLFREIVVILSDKGKFPRDIFISLDRSRSCFSLWSDGHGVASGSLDDKLQRSRKLRQATMKTLFHLSSTLIDRLVPVAHISNPKTKGLCDQVSNILEEVNFSHVADDSSSDSTSEYSTADVHELAEDLKTDVDCLIELDQMIQDPATDPEPEMAEADVSLSSWAPHQVFANKIEHRFPGADAKLFSSLGMVNYQRYLRCQIERDRNQVHAEQPEQVVEVNTGSKFHDSGLGSSLNPASSYAETIMSYRDGNRSIRIPPLPKEAKRGEAFPCVACGRSVIITTNSQWKCHLYIDLQPYVCLDPSCQRSDSTFSNRANWLQHLALDHGMEPTWEQIKCPLCGDEVGPGKIAITTHLGRHLEEISLSALPAAPDSETNSEASESNIDNNYQVNRDNEEEPRDLEVVEDESEGEISDPASDMAIHVVERLREPEGGAAYEKRQHYGLKKIRESSTAGLRRTQNGEMQTPNNKRVLLPANSWRSWEDAIDAAGDQPPANWDPNLLYLTSPSLKPLFDPAASEEIPSKTIHEWQLERQAQRENAMQQEKRKQAVQLPHDPEGQIHNGKEAAFHRRMGEMKTAQKEAKREIEKARIEVEEAAYQRLKAEQKAEEEERARLYAQAIPAAEEAAYKRIKAERAERDRLGAELTAMEARRQSEAEIRDRVQGEARAKMLEIEEALRRQMKDTDDAREELEREYERVNIEAEKAARERLVAKRKAEEERSQKHAEAMAAAEENARLRFEAELKAAESLRQVEAEAREKAEAEARLKINAAVMAANEERARDYVADKVVSGSPRQEVSDRNAGVEHDQRLDDWQTRHWRWICPSCGSEDQDRRKGPVCSNCSYLVGDGDGFATYLPEQRQPQDDEIVTEEQLQEQHQGLPDHQAAFISLDRAPQTEHQYNSKHAEQSISDSIAKNYRNAPNSGEKYIPRELSFLEPSFSVDTHTASLKKKPNPIRSSTAANRAFLGLDSNDPPVLPPIQLGNAKGIPATIPSLNEDTDLVEGFRGHDRDWSLITDLAEQRRMANRMAQRAYRKSL